ncbi:MAG: hypothetical protein NC299_00415 [Lachnospiraceae bacterium]|nr:hypothetical protein [Ruminococcus sp.]MCM1273809.1 hypothetical protein [Lachnospiraceae bacterium]
MKNAKSFLKSAVILTAALAVICVFMPEWGAMQIVIVLLVALLAGLQWFLFFYIRNIK